MKSSLVAVSGILFLALGTLFYFPVGPDSPQSLILPFILFLGWAHAQLGWGAWFAAVTGKELPLWERMTWGSLVTAFAVGVLGFLTLNRNFWILFLAFGVLGNIRAGFKLPVQLGDIFTGLVGVFLLFAAFVPSGFWDPLWYQLTGPRLWFEAGAIGLPENFPTALKTGLWEYQFLLGQVILGSRGDGGGLIAAQVFGQWVHLWCAAGAWATLRWGLRLSWLSALAAVVGTELLFETGIAKNDWAAAWWTVAAAAYLGRPSSGTMRAAKIGAMYGAAFATKFSSMFVLIPFAIWLPLILKSGKAKLAFLGAALLWVAPTTIRNLWFTGNPVFPAGGNLFPSPLLGPSWQGISLYEGYTILPTELWEKVRFLFMQSKGILFLVPAFFISKRGKHSLSLVAAGLVLFLVFTGPKAEWRLVGGGLLLGVAWGIEALVKRWGTRIGLPTVIFLTAFAVWPTAPKLMHEPAEEVRTWVGGAAMAWVRLNVPVGSERVATLCEQRVYYFFPHTPIRAFDVPDLDRELHSARDAVGAVKALRRRGIRWVVLTAEVLDRYFKRDVCDGLARLTDENPSSIMFRTELSRVVDLTLLETSQGLKIE